MLFAKESLSEDVEMDLNLVWRNLFAKWPSNIQRKGVVVTSYGEQILFVQFLIGEHSILLERLAPDAVGGRKVIIPYSRIDAVKTVDPISNEALIPCGFLAPAATTAQKDEYAEESEEELV